MSDASTTRLVLIRHGEVESRYQKVFGGRIDMELSPRGHEQARQVADYLRLARFDALYVSPLKRARQTVVPIADAVGLEPKVIPDLREVDFGVWTGLTWDEVRARHGVNAYDWLRELDRGGIPEAEPVEPYLARVRSAVDQVRGRHPGQTVAVVCHGGVIRAILGILLSLPLPTTAHFEVDYASVSVVDCRSHRVEVQLLNFTPWLRLP